MLSSMVEDEPSQFVQSCCHGIETCRKQVFCRVRPGHPWGDLGEPAVLQILRAAGGLCASDLEVASGMGKPLFEATLWSHEGHFRMYGWWGTLELASGCRLISPGFSTHGVSQAFAWQTWQKIPATPSVKAPSR